VRRSSAGCRRTASACTARRSASSTRDRRRCRPLARNTSSNAPTQPTRIAERCSIPCDRVRSTAASPLSPHDPRFFLQPVQLHLQLSDLPIEFVLLQFVSHVPPFARSGKNIFRRLNQLFLPSCNLIRMDSVSRCQFLNCPLSFDRFQGDLRLECSGVLLPLSSHALSLEQRFSTLGPCPVFGVHFT